jgi:hypothetical protein
MSNKAQTWPADRIGMDGFFCSYYGKCRKGYKCPARFDRLAVDESRKHFFKTRQQVKRFTEEPLCLDDVR